MIIAVPIVAVLAQRVPTWSAENEITTFLKDIVGVNMTKWHLQPAYHSHTAPPDEPNRYLLNCGRNSTDVVVYLKDNKIIWCKLYPAKGTITNYIRTDDNATAHARIVLEKYRAYSGAEYIQPLLNSLYSITELKNSTKVIDNGTIVMQTESLVGRQTIQWMNTVNGIYNDYDQLIITFHNGTVEHIGDNWN